MMTDNQSLQYKFQKDLKALLEYVLDRKIVHTQTDGTFFNVGNPIFICIAQANAGKREVVQSVHLNCSNFILLKRFFFEYETFYYH